MSLHPYLYGYSYSCTWRWIFVCELPASRSMDILSLLILVFKSPARKVKDTWIAVCPLEVHLLIFLGISRPMHSKVGIDYLAGHTAGSSRPRKNLIPWLSVRGGFSVCGVGCHTDLACRWFCKQLWNFTSSTSSLLNYTICNVFLFDFWDWQRCLIS